jgi:hypothetical protein
VVADPAGDMVPLTPLVVVEPEPEELWHLAAALSAPAVSAMAARLAGPPRRRPGSSSERPWVVPTEPRTGTSWNGGGPATPPGRGPDQPPGTD